MVNPLFPKFPPSLADCVQAASLLHDMENLQRDVAVKMETLPMSPSFKATLNTTTLVENGNFKFQPQEALACADDGFMEFINYPDSPPCDKIVKVESRASTPATPAPGLKQDVSFEIIQYDPSQAKPTRGMKQTTRRSTKSPTPVGFAPVKNESNASAPAVNPGPVPRGQVKAQEAALGQSAAAPIGYVPAQNASLGQSAAATAGYVPAQDASLGQTEADLINYVAAHNAYVGQSTTAPAGYVAAQNAPQGQSATAPIGYVAAQNGPDAAASASNPGPSNPGPGRRGKAKAQKASQGQSTPAGSECPAPVETAKEESADDLAKRLKFAAGSAFLTHYGLGTTQLTLKSIDSFVATGHTESLQFSSLEDATNAHFPAKKVEDPTIPRETRHKKVYVWLLCVALQSVAFAADLKLSDLGNLVPPAGFSKVMELDSVVEFCAWQMLDRMIQRHTADTVRTFGKPGQFSTFLDRFNAVLRVLLQRKGISKRLVEMPVMDQVADDPDQVFSRARSNKSTNERKKQQIAKGQEALAEEEANGTVPATKSRASRKRKNSDDDDSEAPASKQVRT